MRLKDLFQRYYIVYQRGQNDSVREWKQYPANNDAQLYKDAVIKRTPIRLRPWYIYFITERNVRQVQYCFWSNHLLSKSAIEAQIDALEKARKQEYLQRKSALILNIAAVTEMLNAMKAELKELQQLPKND